jgi:hypothetical protein
MITCFDMQIMLIPVVIIFLLIGLTTLSYIFLGLLFFIILGVILDIIDDLLKTPGEYRRKLLFCICESCLILFVILAAIVAFTLKDTYPIVLVIDFLAQYF